VKKSRDTCVSRLQDSMLELIKGVGGMSHKVASSRHVLMKLSHFTLCLLQAWRQQAVLSSCV
jgi:hypothetical protein